jgi:hypothetical protein
MLKAELYLWSAKVANDDQQPNAGDLDMAEAALRAVEGNSPCYPRLKTFSPITIKETTKLYLHFDSSMLKQRILPQICFTPITYSSG